MKFTKIIIPLLTASIIFSGCSVPEITESSEEETLTSEISSEETSSDDYFLENNIKFSNLDTPKIDFERDFYHQVSNNFIYTNSSDYLNFVFVDEKGNCYIQFDNILRGYDVKGKKIGEYNFYAGCYKINNTLYTFKEDSSNIPNLCSIYAINLKNGIEKRLHYNTTKPIFCKNKIYFYSDYLINDNREFHEMITYCLENGSMNPQIANDVKKDYDFNLPPNPNNDEENLTVIGNYLYTWHKKGNYISQLNLKTNETKYCKSPFINTKRNDENGEIIEYYSVDDFNFTDHNFFFINNEKIVKTDFNFENRIELDLKLENANIYGMNINRDRIFVKYGKSIGESKYQKTVVEIDKDGKVLKIFE